MKNELRENLESIKSQLIELRQSLHQKHDEVEEEYDKAFDNCPVSSETRYLMSVESALRTAERTLCSSIEYMNLALEV